MITETVIDVRYPDCDPMGIVHHAVYPVWYEIARMDYFEKLGFGYSAMHEKGIDPPMVDLHVQFKASVRYPGKVVVRTREQVGEFTIAVTDDGIGFDAADEAAWGVGLRNTRSRLEAMCGGALEVTSEPGVGTTAVVHVPKGAR